MRRDFDLLPDDATFLEQCGHNWETVVDGSQWVLLSDYPVPTGYTQIDTTAAIRLEAGYPDAQLDMVYFHPPLSRSDGVPIPATSSGQMIAGRQFQRWSRHRTAKNPWLAGQDCLETHILLIDDWLEREFERR